MFVLWISVDCSFCLVDMAFGSCCLTSEIKHHNPFWISDFLGFPIHMDSSNRIMEGTFRSNALYDPYISFSQWKSGPTFHSIGWNNVITVEGFSYFLGSIGKSFSTLRNFVHHVGAGCRWSAIPPPIKNSSTWNDGIAWASCISGRLLLFNCKTWPFNFYEEGLVNSKYISMFNFCCKLNVLRFCFNTSFMVKESATKLN